MRLRDALSKEYKAWVLLVPIMAAGCALSLYRLDAKPFWIDELVVVRAALEPLRQGLESFKSYSDTPPLYFFIIHAALHLGEGEWFARLPAVIFGTFSIAALYLLASRLFGRATGLLSALLFTTAPLRIIYSQEARFYIFFTLLYLLALHAFFMIQRTGKARYYLGFAVLFPLSLFTHYFSVLYLACNLALLGASLYLIGRTSVGQREAKKRLLTVLAVAAVSMALFFPWILKVPDYASRNSIGAPEISLPFLLRTLSSLGSGGFWPTLIETALALAGVLLSLRSRKAETAFLLVNGLGFIVLALCIVELTNHRYGVRYVTCVQPLYLILIARGIWKLSGVVFSAAGARGSRSLLRTMLAAFGIAAILLMDSFALRDYYRSTVKYICPQDWRAATRHLRDHLEENAAVYAKFQFASEFLLHYLLEKPDRPDRILLVSDLFPAGAPPPNPSGRIPWWVFPAFDAEFNHDLDLIEWWRPKQSEHSARLKKACEELGFTVAHFTGVLLVTTGRPVDTFRTYLEKMASLMEAYIEVYPSFDFATYITLGQSLEHLGRMEEAAGIYRRGLGTWPNEPTFRQSLDRLSRQRGWPDAQFQMEANPLP